MKNHAFMITCYKQPKLVARIMRVLSGPNHYFFVHVDKKSDIKPYIEESRDINNVCFTRQISVYHARISQLKSELVLLRTVREFEIRNNITFDYVHMISGNDYPLRSNEQFDQFFENTESTFMLYDRDEYWDKNRDNIEHSVNYYHLNRGGFISTLFSKTLGIVLSFIIPRQRINNLAGGWDWWSWNARTFNYVLGFLDTHPSYLRRWNHTVCVTEKFFHTILAEKREEFKIETWNPLRFVSWKPRRDMGANYNPYRPYDLTEREFELVINSKAFFCRKVDEIESSSLLDMIDSQRGSCYNLIEHDYFS